MPDIELDCQFINNVETINKAEDRMQHVVEDCSSRKVQLMYQQREK